MSSIRISDTTALSTQVSAFYEVDDYSNPEKKPGYSNSMSSTAGIEFTGNSTLWKSEKVSETLRIDNATELAKLEAYPFHAIGDVFDNPEYPTNQWAPKNWMLAHKIEVTYHYTKGAQLVQPYELAFDINGGTPLASLTAQQVFEGALATAPTSNPSREDYAFTGWNTERDGSGNSWDFATTVMPNHNVTLYAQWLGDPAVVNVKYRDDSGRDLYAEVLKGRVGQEYRAPFYSFEGYTLVTTPTNWKGIYTKDPIEVIFVYKAIPPNPNPNPTPTPTDPTQSGPNGGGSSNPATGDNSSALVFVVLLFGALFVFLKSLLKKRAHQS